MHRPK